MSNHKFVLTTLTFTCASVLGMALVQRVHSDNAPAGPLHAEMRLVSSSKFAPGEPVLIHYSVVNESPSEAATFFVGDTGRDWYSIRSFDAGGHLLRAVSQPRSQVRKPEGLYQPAERTLSPGGRLEGDIVASDFLSPTVPGQYSLQVKVSLDYVMQPENSGDSAMEATNHFASSKDFAFTTTVTASNPGLVHAKAEALRQQLLRGGTAENSKTTMEELFAMPEAVALPVWQALVADPASSDFVLSDAAKQLSLHPSRASADLVAQMLWNTDRDADTRSPSQTADLWTAMSKLYQTAAPDLKPYIRSLYIAHGVPASEVDRPAVKSHPN